MNYTNEEWCHIKLYRDSYYSHKNHRLRSWVQNYTLINILVKYHHLTQVEFLPDHFWTPLPCPDPWKRILKVKLLDWNSYSVLLQSSWHRGSVPHSHGLVHFPYLILITVFSQSKPSFCLFLALDHDDLMISFQKRKKYISFIFFQLDIPKICLVFVETDSSLSHLIVGKQKSILGYDMGAGFLWEHKGGTFTSRVWEEANHLKS